MSKSRNYRIMLKAQTKTYQVEIPIEYIPLIEQLASVTRRTTNEALSLMTSEFLIPLIPECIASLTNTPTDKPIRKRVAVSNMPTAIQPSVPVKTTAAENLPPNTPITATNPAQWHSSATSQPVTRAMAGTLPAPGSVSGSASDPLGSGQLPITNRPQLQTQPPQNPPVALRPNIPPAAPITRPNKE